MPELTRREAIHAGAVGLGAVALASPVVAKAAATGRRSFHYDHVCGTSLDVEFTADRNTDAEERVLAEVDRLTAVFSLFNPNSELSRFNRSNGAVAVSPDLVAVLAEYEAWAPRTGGALNPRVGAFVNLWADAERTQRLPDAGFLADAAQRLAHPGFARNGSTAVKSGDAPLNLNAIAKGYIIARMATVLKATPGVSSGLVDLGGDMAAFGEAFTVGVQDPHQPFDNAPPLGTFALQNASVATSGGTKRFATIGGKRYSHLIDPRTGQPASAVASATVIATTSTGANALATALGVMNIEEGLRLIGTVAGAECLLVDAAGTLFRSHGFPLRPFLCQGEAPKANWPAGFQVSVALELPAIGGGRYRKPYVAVWIEDAAGKPVRTLQVWGSSPKYTKDLTDWWAFAKGNAALIKATTQPTRNPGKYTMVWDGKDDAGQALPQGTYTVKVEVHREHGKHVRQSGKLECGKEKAEVKLAKNDEAGETVVTYGPGAKK